MEKEQGLKNPLTNYIEPARKSKAWYFRVVLDIVLVMLLVFFLTERVYTYSSASCPTVDKCNACHAKIIKELGNGTVQLNTNDIKNLVGDNSNG